MSLHVPQHKIQIHKHQQSFAVESDVTIFSRNLHLTNDCNSETEQGINLMTCGRKKGKELIVDQGSKIYLATHFLQNCLTPLDVHRDAYVLIST